jgi:hypothetical protein
MVDFKTFRQLALSLPGTEEKPHFNLVSFRVQKKIFATFWEKENRAMIKLSIISQSVFCTYDNSIFFPVPGAWGRKGATFVDLEAVPKKIFKEALTIAYNEGSAKKTLKKM